VRDARVVIKDGAFRVLAGMLDLIGTYALGTPDPGLDTALLQIGPRTR
jgi:hypothetical protein